MSQTIRQYLIDQEYLEGETICGTEGGYPISFQSDDGSDLGQNSFSSSYGSCDLVIVPLAYRSGSQTTEGIETDEVRFMIGRELVARLAKAHNVTSYDSVSDGNCDPEHMWYQMEVTPHTQDDVDRLICAVRAYDDIMHGEWIDPAVSTVNETISDLADKLVQ